MSWVCPQEFGAEPLAAGDSHYLKNRPHWIVVDTPRGAVLNDPHYADHWRIWAEGKYVPMLLNGGAAEDACEARIVLAIGSGR